MIRAKKPSRIRVGYMQYKEHGPGWYWWIPVQIPVYHGPFPDEATARRDLERTNKDKDRPADRKPR